MQECKAMAKKLNRLEGHGDESSQTLNSQGKLFLDLKKILHHIEFTRNATNNISKKYAFMQLKIKSTQENPKLHPCPPSHYVAETNPLSPRRFNPLSGF